MTEPWRLYLLLGGLAAVVATGCTTARSDTDAVTARPVSPSSFAAAGAGDGRQYLFNVRYSGPEGGGALRLVLRLTGQGDFQISTADTLGRSRWSLQLKEARTLLLDHRQETFCRGGEGLHLGEASLTVLPVGDLPRLLLGELPADLTIPDSADGSRELIDGVGRKWSVRVRSGELEAWTLWIDEKPTLWWTRQNKGGILSHRDGSQFRWRLAVAEPLASSVPGLAPPEHFAQVRCDEYQLPELRQDQPAPPGA